MGQQDDNSHQALLDKLSQLRHVEQNATIEYYGGNGEGGCLKFGTRREFTLPFTEVGEAMQKMNELMAGTMVMTEMKVGDIATVKKSPIPRLENTKVLCISDRAKQKFVSLDRGRGLLWDEDVADRTYVDVYPDSYQLYLEDINGKSLGDGQS